MVATLETLLLLLAVLVAVAIASRRLNIAPSILLVIAGVGLALDTRAAAHRPGAGTGAARDAAAADLFGRGRHELARVSLQSAPDHTAGGRLPSSSRRARLPRRPLAAGHAAGLWASCSVRSSRRPMWLRRSPIARPLGLPRRLLVVLEGEGLVNDATALILYRFAVAAVGTGVLASGRGSDVRADRRRRDRLRHRHRLAQPAAAPLGERSARRNHLVADDTLFAYWLPQQLGGSGVLATVAAGLYVSWNGPLLISRDAPARHLLLGPGDLSARRLGVPAHRVFRRARCSSASAGFPVSELVVRVASHVAVVIVARFIWVFPATYLPRWLIPLAGAARSRRRPGRGVPARLPRRARRGLPGGGTGDTFHDRKRPALPVPRPDLLHHLRRDHGHVGRPGLSAAAVVRWLGLAQTRADEHLQEHAAELAARWDTLKLAQDRLDALADDVPAQVMTTLHAHHDYRVARLPKTVTDGVENAHLTSKLRRDLIAEERNYIYRQLQDGKITDEVPPPPRARTGSGRGDHRQQGRNPAALNGLRAKMKGPFQRLRRK